MKNKDWMKPAPSPMLRELLERVSELTTKTFLILPESGHPKTASFAAMEVYEKFCVMRDHIDWNHYFHNGVSIRQGERIMNNVLEGRPREDWLEEPIREHGRAIDTGRGGREM